MSRSTPITGAESKSYMDKVFWQDRWQRHEIGFHQPRVHEQLTRFWPGLNLAAESTVFVPLSGKSRDMLWLAEQGHRVVGVELSGIAVNEFFEEAGLRPEYRAEGAFEVYTAGPFLMYRGDFFELTAEALQAIAAVYDRAALIALPADMRSRYVTMLASILPRRTVILLISVDYPEREITGPPFAVPSEEVHRLFGSLFDVEVLEKRDGLAATDNLRKRGVTRLDETAYLLRRWE
jgi:thiopurine S-methyltransferase